MERDRELVRWISRLGAVGVGHVGGKLGVGRSVAYDVVARLVDARLLERVALLRGERVLIRATAEGNGVAELGLPVARITPALVSHWLACADVALWAERRYGSEAVISERELRLLEQIEGRPIASAEVGELPSGAPRLHRPDLAIRNGAERPTAIEVELSPKAPWRLQAIVRAWRRAANVERVIYLAAPGETMRGVERAVARSHAQARVAIREIARDHE
jgi:hypothetical protein